MGNCALHGSPLALGYRRPPPRESLMRTFALIPILLLAGCGSDSDSASVPPPPPPKPEAQATQLRDAVKAPLDKAHEAEQLLEHSTDDTDTALDRKSTRLNSSH